jgi:hypothetical protein
LSIRAITRLFERDLLRAQFFDKIGGLLEWHVAIVVAMNKEHTRAPVRDAFSSEFIERKPLMMRPCT